MNDTLAMAKSKNIPRNVTLVVDQSESRMYKNMPQDMVLAMATDAVSMFNNEYRVDPDTFATDPNLQDYNVVATAVDKIGQHMVASIEHKDYPIYAHQFHPEKAQFIWKIDLPIPHSKMAMDVCKHLLVYLMSIQILTTF